MSQFQLDEEAIFDFARKIESPDLRTAYLDQVCGADKKLMDRVAELLQAHDAEASFLERPPAELDATVEAPTVRENPGDTIGPYKLLQRIGEGGFGVVYMAEQTRPVRRKVALKVIKPGMDTKEVIARFEAERQALAMMDHPNIAKVFDGGETESGHPFFVMELVRGVPLNKFCDENSLSTNQRLELFTRVCRAVQHAHQKGIIHRDLKPSNVMVTLHDNKPVPKVIDFGVSKAISQRLTERTLFTAYGQMVGTPVYMSPEQAQMSGLDVDTRSDIYSLGAMLYELLTGATPLDAEQLRKSGYAEMQRIIREQEAPKPSQRLSTESGEALARIAKNRGTEAKQLSNQIHGDLDWIVMKALEKDRNRRYETANGFARDVERYLLMEPVAAGPPTAAYRIRKLLRRHQRSFAVACGILIALLVGLAGTSSGWLAERRERKLKEAANQRAEKARIEAKDAQARAENSLYDREIANRELESLTKSQKLVIAYEALARRNIEAAREFLSSDTGAPPTALAFPRQFLGRQCDRFTPKSVSFDEKISRWIDDPQAKFRVVALSTCEIVFVDLDGQEIASLHAPVESTNDIKLRINDLCMTDDGELLVVAYGSTSLKKGDTGLLKAWRIRREASTLRFENHLSVDDFGVPVVAVQTLGATGRTAVLDVQGALKVLDLSTGKSVVEKRTGHTASRRQYLGRIPGRKLIFSFGWDGQLNFYREDSAESIYKIRYRGRLYDVSVSADEASCILCGTNGTEVWDLTSDPPKKLRNLTSKFSGASKFGKNGRQLAITKLYEYGVLLFDFATGKIIDELPHRFTGREPTDRTLSTLNGEITWADITSLHSIRVPSEDLDWVSTDTFWHSPIGTCSSSPLVVYPGENHAVKLWNTETGEVSSIEAANRKTIHALAISESGKRLAVARRSLTTFESEEVHLSVWTIDDHSLEAEFSFLDGIWSLDFSPSDENILLVSGRAVFLLNVDSRQSRMLQPRLGGGEVVTSRFSPDGTRVVIGGNCWFGSGTGRPGQLWEVADPANPKFVSTLPISENRSGHFVLGIRSGIYVFSLSIRNL